jgi:predicted anti-sigma-YlaC factor YlaD
VEKHISRCAECRAELAALERTGALLAAMDLEQAPEWTREELRVQLASRGRRVFGPQRRWAWGAAVGALAVVMAVLAVMFFGPVRTTAPAPHTVVAAEPDAEIQATMQGHLSMAWSAPLADEAALGLRLATLEEDG